MFATLALAAQAWALPQAASRPAAQAVMPAAPPGGAARPAPLPMSQAHRRFLDRLVTARHVFPDRAQRARYERLRDLSATQDPGWHSVAYSLRQQRGMDRSRHYHIIAFSFAPAGTFVKDADGAPVPSGGFGPGGGTMDLAGRTADGAFDVRVSSGMLLPAGVQAAPIDLRETLDTVLARYARQRPPRRL